MTYTFISGATGGIGKAFTFSCAKKGYNLFITGRSEEKLCTLKNSIEKEYNVTVKTCACDLTSELSRKEMLSYIDQNEIKFNRIINVYVILFCRQNLTAYAVYHTKFTRKRVYHFLWSVHNNAYNVYFAFFIRQT